MSAAAVSPATSFMGGQPTSLPRFGFEEALRRRRQTVDEQSDLCENNPTESNADVVHNAQRLSWETKKSELEALRQEQSTRLDSPLRAACSSSKNSPSHPMPPGGEDELPTDQEDNHQNECRCPAAAGEQWQPSSAEPLPRIFPETSAQERGVSTGAGDCAGSEDFVYFAKDWVLEPDSSSTDSETSDPCGLSPLDLWHADQEVFASASLQQKKLRGSSRSKGRGEPEVRRLQRQNLKFVRLQREACPLQQMGHHLQQMSSVSGTTDRNSLSFANGMQIQRGLGTDASAGLAAVSSDWNFFFTARPAGGVLSAPSQSLPLQHHRGQSDGPPTSDSFGASSSKQHAGPGSPQHNATHMAASLASKRSSPLQIQGNPRGNRDRSFKQCSCNAFDVFLA